MTRFPFADRYGGGVHEEHRNEPAPRTRKGQEHLPCTHRADTRDPKSGFLKPYTCTFYYTRDDVTLRRDGGVIKKSVFCPKCREDVELE